MMERKMHWGRRLAALALCLCSVLSILPLPAHAEETTAETAETAETQAPAETVEETQETQAAEPEQTQEAEIVTEETEPTMARPMPRPVGPVLTAQAEDIQAQAQTFLENALPEDAALAMTVLREEEFENCWAQVEAALETPLTQALFFDLRLLSGETEVEPAAGTVTVKVTLPQELEAGFVDVVHFKQTYVARLDAQVEGTTVTFQTDSFSRFGVIVRESRVPDGGWGVFKDITVSFNLNNVNLPPVPSFTATGSAKMKSYFDDGKIPTTVEDVDANGHPNKIFQGWFNSRGGTQYISSSKFSNNDMTFYAKWENPPAVTFDIGDAKNQPNAPAAPESIRVHPGNSLSDYTAPPLPTLEWKDADGSWVKAFDGWFTAQNVEFTDETTIDKNTTVYAHWTELVKITFNMGEAVEGQTPPPMPAVDPVLPGSTLVLPQDPVWEVGGEPFRLFMGWFTDAECTDPFDASEPVEKDTELYAKWAEPVTVTFAVGGDRDGYQPPRAPADMVVAAGTTGLTLPTVKWLDEDKAPLYFLEGWYYDAGCTNPYDPDTPINENTTLHAKWVEANGENTVTVSFHFTEGNKDVVVMTRQVLKGQTVQAPAGPIAKDRLFEGWSKEEQTEDGSFTKFDFSTPIENDLHLYAWYSEICTVTFEMNGGNPIPPLIVAKGEKISEETLKEQAVRYGYELVQWTTDPENQTPFDFEKAINESITLYADWKAVMAQVHIVELFEDANQDIYNDPAEVDHRIVWAPVGSYVNVKDLDPGLQDKDRYDANHDIVYSTTPLSAGVETEFVQTKDPTGKETGKIRDSREDPTISGDDTHYFQYLRSSTDAKVRPDGSTTLYVYYRRVRVTLHFNFVPGTTGDKESTPTTTKAKIDPVISDMDREKYAVAYSNNSDENGFTYQLTAKYKQQIASVWLRNVWLTLVDQKGTTGNREFNAWALPDGGRQTTLMHTMEANLIDKSKYKFDSEGQLCFECDLPAVGKSGDRLVNIWLLYILDTLPGETPDFVYKNKYYTVRSQGGQQAKMEQFVTYKQLSIANQIFSNTLDDLIIFNQPYNYAARFDGTDYTALMPTSTSINGYNSKRTGKSLNNIPIHEEVIKGYNGETIASIFTRSLNKFQAFKDDMAIAPLTQDNYFNFQVLPYNRHKVTLEVHPNHQGYIENQGKYTQNCLKEELIFDKEEGDFSPYFDEKYPDILLKFNNPDGTWKDYSGDNETAKAFEQTHRFVGWYTTPSFSKGTEFFPNADSRILTSMELYAKWEPVAFQAQYHVLDETYEEGFEEGDYLIGYPLNELPNLTFSEELEKNFIGWYWYSPNDPDTLVPFNFDQPVGENFTQDGVLHLYAQFNPVSSEVIYHRGSNEALPPDPIQDSTGYSLGTAYRLKQPDEVWNAGAITATNKEFLGWERNGKYYRPGQYVVITAPAMDFTALWADEPIKLIYNGNGATQVDVEEWMEKGVPHPVWNNMDVNEEYDLKDPASQWVPHFTWEGHKLLGWSTTPTGGVEYELDGATITPDGEKDKITLYAVWETQVTITYHPNSRAAKPQDTHQTSHSPGSTVLAWDNKVYGGDYFTNEGYIFLGWSTEEGVHDVTYAPNALIDLSKLDENNNLNLYAQWEQDESAVPRVVYHSNYQDAGMTEQEKIDIGEYQNRIQVWRNTTDGEPAFEKPGYVFLGWSQNSNAKVPDTGFAAPWVKSDEDKPDHAAAKEIYFDPEGDEVIDYYAVWGPMPDIQVQVKKLVEGSLGDSSKSFSFTMTYPKLDGATETKTFELKHGGENAEFSVPKGTTLTITENDANDYTMTCDRDGAVNDHTATVKLPAEAPSGPYVITIINKKDPTPDTGVSLDSLPALILLAVSVLGGGVLLLRRRRYL